MIEEGTALIEDDLEDNPGTNDIVNNDTTHDVEPSIPNELRCLKNLHTHMYSVPNQTITLKRPNPHHDTDSTEV